MFSATRYSSKKLLSQSQKPFQARLLFVRSQCFLNLFNKSACESKNSHRKKIGFYDENIFERVVQNFKESLLDGPQYEFQKEKRHALKEAKKREELAQRYFNLGQYQNALENFKGTLYLLKQHCQKDDPRLVHYLHKIGDVYYEVKEWDQAINSYEEGLEILANSFGTQDQEVGRCYFLLGMCYVKQKKYAFAIENLNKSLKIYEAEPFEHQQTIASCYSMLAECYLQFGKYEEVFENTQKLLNLLREMYKDEKLEEINDPLMTQYYLNLGFSIAYTHKDYEKAEELLSKYLKSQIAMNICKGGTVGICYLRMGQVKAMQGLHNEAVNLYEKSIEIAVKSVGCQSKILGTCYNAIGMSLLEEGKYKEAQENFEKSVEFFEESPCLELAICYRNMGLAWFKQGKKAKAIESFRKSAEERAKVFEGFYEGELELGVLHACISGLSHEKGEGKAAIVHFEKALEEFMMLSAKEVKDSLNRKKVAW